MPFRATRDKKYLVMAESLYRSFYLSSSWAFSWDDKTAGVHLILYGLTKKQAYGQAIQRYLSSWLPGNETYTLDNACQWKLAVSTTNRPQSFIGAFLV